MNNPPKKGTKPGGVDLQKVDALTKMWQSVRLSWSLICDRRVRFVQKMIPVLAGLYVMSPLDFLPDVLPVIGQLDDITIFAGGIWVFLNLVPPQIIEEHMVRLGFKAPPSHAGTQQTQTHANSDVVDAEYREVPPDEGGAVHGSGFEMPGYKGPTRNH